MNPRTTFYRRGRLSADSRACLAQAGRRRRATPNCTTKGTKNTKGFGGARPQSSCLLFFFVSFVVGFPVDRLFSASSAHSAVTSLLLEVSDAT